MLRSMQPELLDGSYVFITLPGASYGDFSDLDPLASVREKEGLTLVVPKDKADSTEHSYDAVMRCISLNVHSALEAPGLVAAFSTALADQGISCNLLAGYYHDHIFIPEHQSTEALQVLIKLSADVDG